MGRPNGRPARRLTIHTTGVHLLLLLACDADPTAVSTAEAAPAAPPAARLAEPPGFQAVGTGPGPIYVSISLNVNDHLRPAREAQAVRRFLDSTARVGIDPVELSFSGEAQHALLAADPGLRDAVVARRPTLQEHYRLLQWRRLQDTEHELYFMDPQTLELDRTRPGPLVRMQQDLGVTPRDGGGAPAELLRRAWTRAPGTAALVAAGLSKVDKSALLAHPDRLVAAMLDPAEATPGQRFVDGYLTVYRQLARVKGGAKTAPAEVDARLDDLARWAHVAKLMGFDVAKAPTVTTLVDPARLGAFLVEPTTWVASDAEHAALRARPDAAAELDRAFATLCAWTCALADPAAEMTARLNALDPGRAWAARLSWHATDDYTVGIWSESLTRAPGRAVPADVRPAAEQARIAAGHEALLAALRAHPRVRFVSLDNDTQWAPENAPAAGWKAAFDVDLAALPSAADADAIDARAEAEGVRTQVPERPRSGPRRR